MGTSVRVALTQAGGAGGAHWARHALHLGERRGSLILLNKRDLEALMAQLQSQALADGTGAGHEHVTSHGALFLSKLKTPIKLTV